MKAKRVFDLLVATLLSIPALILGAVVSMIILVADQGPILYRSRRIGEGGRNFDMFKFRTMYMDGEMRLSPEERLIFAQEFKLKKDPRVTPLGRWLRRFGLDELPQLVNVLRGEMSLVGPRPKLPEEIYLFGNQQGELLSVKPGITGYWQVFRKTAASDATMRRMDLDYVKHRDLFMDIRLLLVTPLVLIKNRNV